MTTEKILAVVAKYRKELEKHGIPKQRMDPQRRFGMLSQREMLMHAHYLLDGIEQYAKEGREAKCGRHLGSVQTILGFALWYSLEDVMQHNMMDPPAT